MSDGRYWLEIKVLSSLGPNCVGINNLRFPANHIQVSYANFSEKGSIDGN